jgi:Fur family transcriptional regulator, ferric uptake regulator
VSVEAEIHDQVALRLARFEQRYTRLRRALVETLAGAGRPLTIPEILATNPGLTQSTAYRNITVLIDAGAARRVTGADDHGRFELAEDLSAHHHHLVCATCGKVSDILPSARLERALAEAARAAADRGDFDVTDHRFDLLGVCAECR